MVDWDYVKRVECAVENAYSGVLLDYHKALGERIARAIAVWVPPESVEDVLCEIRNCRREVDEFVGRDAHRSRYRKD